MNPARPRLATTRRARLARASWALLALCAALAAAPAWGRGSADEQVGEYEVKAAFVTHFFGYVRWPEDVFESERAPLVLVVVGEDPFGRILDETLRGRQFSGRGVRILRAPSTRKLPDAHMVFVPRAANDDLPAVLERYHGPGTLVIADEAGLAARGAGAGFYLAGGKVRFEVNVDALARQRLEASSQLLKLARIVRDERRAEDGR